MSFHDDRLAVDVLSRRHKEFIVIEAVATKKVLLLQTMILHDLASNPRIVRQRTIDLPCDQDTVQSNGQRASLEYDHVRQCWIAVFPAYQRGYGLHYGMPAFLTDAESIAEMGAKP